MELVPHHDVAEFARLARPLFDADPIRHTVTLTVLDSLVRTGDSPAALITVHEEGRVQGAVLRTVARPAQVSGVQPRHAATVAAALLRVDPEAPGVAGPVPEVEAFATAWSALTGAGVHVDIRLRLFTLDALVVPIGVPGDARGAGESDLDLLGVWRCAFVGETGVGWVDPLTPREVVTRSLTLGNGELLWEVDGVPVAQASARRPVAGMSRIGPVYTPPEHRRHGYGAAVAAAASRWALDAGAEHVLLFTDVTNPTTNALYPRLGYRPVHDALEVAFAGMTLAGDDPSRGMTEPRV